MQRMKWFFITTLLVTLSVLIFPLDANAASEGDYTYSVSNGEATITDYSSSSGSLTIPSELGGYPVTQIGPSAFSYNSKLTSVIIPDSVTSIGDSAFYYCTALTEINLPNSVISIGDSAFASCSRLTSVTLGDSVTTIGAWAFSHTPLTSLTIGAALSIVEDHAFYGCSKLKIFYSGSPTQWQNISVEYGNACFESATVNYHIHNYTPSTLPAVAPTCAEFGYTTLICECGNTSRKFIPALGHQQGLVIRITDPNCTKQGYTQKWCKECSNLYTDDFIPALGHDFTIYSNDNNATCTLDGTMSATCNRCSATDTLPNPGTKLNHSYTLNSNYTCDVCGYSTKPAQPLIESKFSNCVILVNIQGLEYSKDGYIWQDSNVFSELKENTSYTFYQRVKASSDTLASDPSSGLTLTLKSSQPTPSAPTIFTFTSSTVILAEITNGEYSLDGISWQETTKFTGLEPDTTYTFYQRYSETNTHEASAQSYGTSITTENTVDFAGGNGTEATPFVIQTITHLNNIRKYPSSYYIIANNITFDPENTALPTGWKPFAFKGHLDGQGHKIAGIRITVSNTAEYQWYDPGLFSSNSGTIENLTVDDMRISVSSMGGKYGGFICAVNTGEIINCHSANCTIVLQNTYHFFGGIAGNNSGSIHNCTSNNSINWGANGGRIGGITANNTGSINYCTNNGTITNFGAYTPISGGISALNSGNIISSNNLSPIITKSTYSQTSGYSGGVVGQMTKGTISQCYNLEAITAEATEYKASAYSGGIVAYISGGNILDCYNTGDIYGETNSSSARCYVGGIIGYNNSIGTLKNCYSVGATSGRAASSNLYVGYVCGYNASNTIENFYYLGVKDNGAGYGDSSAMQGLNASQMKNQESFSGYDFQLIWEFREKNAYGYPTLINNEHFEFDYSLSFAECKNGEIIGTSDNIQQSSDQNIYFKLLKDAEINLSLTNDLYIDLNGYTLTGTIITNSYTVYGMDSTTDSYSCEAIGYFNCVDENGNAIVPVTHFKSDITGPTKRYMAIKDENGYSFHRFYLGITKVSLDPSVTGFGYKAEFYGDEMVQQQIASIGYNLWLNEDHVVSRTTAFKNTLTLRLKNFDVANYGETPVNASVCIILADGTIIESSVTSMSMRNMLESINAQYDKYSDVQLSAVKAMIEKHAIIKSWDTKNLFA